MPLSFESFQGEGVFGFGSGLASSDSHKTWFNQDKTRFRQEQEVEDLGYVVGEPNSVLEALRSPSPLLSHSTTTTLSSSHGGGAVTTTGDDDNKCSPMGLDDLDGVVLSPPTQEQSILKLIMDPGSGFGVFDPGFSFGSGSLPVHETPNPLFSFQEHHQELFTPNQFSPPPPAKRFNPGPGPGPGPVFPFPDPDPDPGRFQFPFQFQQQQQQEPNQSTSLATPVCMSTLMAGDDESVIIEQLFNAAELLTTTTTSDQTILAQGILARLNHHLNNNTPFQRSAFYISQTLLSLLHSSPPPLLLTPESLILKISAYRTFSETSPFLQFVNFTSNQSILESCQGFDQIHIIDFDIGYGGQWSSLMQELSRRRNRTSLKITAFASPPSTVSEEFELRFTEENLRSFAGEVKIPFEIELLSIELLLNQSYWPITSEKEAICVNLPLNSVYSSYLPLILRYLKQLSPNVVVCSDSGCVRNDAPFPNAVIGTLQYYTSLIESLGSGGGDDSVERFLVKPMIEKVLMKRHRWIEKVLLPWRNLFMQCGFTPVSFSSTAESQAECLVSRNVWRGGFHVEKRQSSSSIVLCWQRKELVTVSAWKCC
ncbi:hypothetical protein AALP_AA4G240400 [Arabis alpina]|uniref:Uncharacterized protein n=1 Tax=Arabis alpina TaxID=50452 RepID=A0A087H5A7_ARAAL|nr:hypothetical protein AALP_AA4G240400 [Arabis alpina]